MTLKQLKIFIYNKLIYNSRNKIKSAWSNIKTVTGKGTNSSEAQLLNIDGKLIDNHHLITDSLNNYFLTIADKININNAKGSHTKKSDIDKHWSYLPQAFPTPFPETRLNPASTKEI
jgi:hypothetical protein